ncbi:transcriptional regulator with XRE-family HTH domain [Actinoalloteichus hoggarensis]|uniref:Putative sporulation protein n=1 Tax=Actinoalloteichus hoggarensis TaxID=1470176 RepID=A0A221W8A3_9PSEU|nr:helix-turn-helix transcriptional regulator [Actinoalloteichus hoggarensis]ASO21826.1 Putative sporulation protein [Actinoalloteichus hoggarensis]MBB5922425.1 transcriptional regulator with XRE-family HTH domain [Actinoalloteichus hoggarensis]
MNTAGDSPKAPVDPAVWHEPEMRACLAVRDIGAVYRQLKRRGVSQRRIAGLTGQAQPEISEIMNGRQVMAYDVLSRIADGLGVPRGLMGLAYDGAQAVDLREQTEGDSDMERRGFLGLVAKAAVVGLSASELESIRVLPEPGPRPSRVGMQDVANLEATIGFFRAQDDRYGGGSVRSAVTAHLNWADGLLEAAASDVVRTRLQQTLADLHSLAGWVSFDLGSTRQAVRHLANALVLAKDSREHALAAKVLFQMGRVYLHDGEPDNALKVFQLGQMSAQDANSPRAVALLHLNEAWAYAELGNAQQTRVQLTRAAEELTRDTDQDVPSWLAFMSQAEIEGIAGMAYTALSARDRSFAEAGLEHATRSFDMRAETDARSRTSDLIAIAVNRLRAGEVAGGVRAGAEVLERMSGVRSSRLVDRLGWVQQAAELHAGRSDARDLAEQVSRLRSA